MGRLDTERRRARLWRRVDVLEHPTIPEFFPPAAEAEAGPETARRIGKDGPTDITP